MRQFTPYKSPFTLAALLAIALLFPASAETLEEGFAAPPQTAGIRCWWWWLNGNVTKEAITRDLEEMKAKGFSGACVFDADGASQGGNARVPDGPMFGSPEWRALFKHAAQEADRLNLVLSLSIQSGWNLGGPDITPEEATKHLTWSELRVRSGEESARKLPLPITSDDFYRDIAVVAYPARKAAATDAAKPASGNGSKHSPVRDLSRKAVFEELGGSAPDTRFLLNDHPDRPGELDARLADVVDLTDRLQPDGTLNWSPPAGEWVVLRFGYTCTPARVSTSSGAWQGRVIDYMSADSMRRYWTRHVEPILNDIGPLAGRTLKYLQTDSWELGGINWTDSFAQEFRRRRGYEITPYLPVIAGRIIESRDVGTRFLADFRKTISDCISDNHYGVFAQLAHQHGLGLQPESAGPHAGPFDGLKNYGHSDIMMGEFWVPSPHRPGPSQRFFVKQAASAAHIYNRRLVGAEAFTSIGPHWNDTLWSAQKPSFDHELCAGLNIVLVHTFTCSPKEMGLPGQEYFAGTHFNPQVTWWPMAGEFIRYLSRCQYLGQQGRFQADALYYYGDHVPNIARLKQDDPARVLPGFDYDIINEDLLLDGLSVKDGRLTLAHGPSYRLLALPDHKVLSLAALRKIHALVQAGATVLGPKTERTVSLAGFPQSENELKRLADDLWGKAESVSGEKRLGKGRLVWGRTAREVLLSNGVPLDFEARCRTNAIFDYIHYTLADADCYFVCNQAAEPQMMEAVFRTQSKQPELWDPITGQQRMAMAFRQEENRTIVPLEFAPYGSTFVIFRKSISPSQQGTEKSNYPVVTPVAPLEGPWQVRFHSQCDAPQTLSFDKLVSWTDRPEPGIKYYSGAATYKRTFDLPAAARHTPPTTRILLDLGNIGDVSIARVCVNGKDCGITWSPPFQVDITGALNPAGNTLEIEVVNSWRNRLVGDRGLATEKRVTRTNVLIRPEWQLVPSGLFGPVQILLSKS